MRVLRINARGVIRTFGIYNLNISEEQKRTDIFKEAIRKIDLKDFKKEYEKKLEYRNKKNKKLHIKEFKEMYNEAIRMIKAYKKD